jgi:hypothetical protein
MVINMNRIELNGMEFVVVVVIVGIIVVVVV